jgi:hypothetical protein
LDRVRVKRAPHIQHQAIHLNLLQRNSLDVIGFLLFALYISFKVVVCSVKLVFRKIFKKLPEKNVEKKKKN